MKCKEPQLQSPSACFAFLSTSWIEFWLVKSKCHQSFQASFGSDNHVMAPGKSKVLKFQNLINFPEMGEFLTGISDQNLPRHCPLPASSNFKPNVHLNVTTLHRRSTKPPSKSSNPEVVATQLQALHNHLHNKSLNHLHNPIGL